MPCIFPTCLSICLTAFPWLELILERALFIRSSRPLSFRLFDGKAWLVPGFVGTAGAYTPRSMETVFSMPFSSRVTMFRVTHLMQNGPVLGSKSLWYALVASRCSSWSLVATSYKFCSIKKYIHIRSVDSCFACRVVILLFVALLRLSRMGLRFPLHYAHAGSRAWTEDLKCSYATSIGW